MKKSTKTNIILTVAVVLAAALVAGVFTALFIDRSPVEDTPSDVVDVPDIPDMQVFFEDRCEFLAAGR